MRSAATTGVRRTRLGLLGHLLTAARHASSLLIFGWIAEGSTQLAAAVLVAAMLTDLADGPLVRRFGRPSKAGALFDVWADFLVIVAAYAGMTVAGILPFWPLLPIGASFAVFIATSHLGPAMYDPVGRYIGGILMAGALGILLAQDFIAQHAIASAMAIACIATIAARLAHVLTWPRRSALRGNNAACGN